MAAVLVSTSAQAQPLPPEIDAALAPQLALAVAEAVGVDATADVNIAPLLLEARGRGSEVVDKYCLPKIRDVLERELRSM
jgi:hypothetical protein